MHQRRGYTLDNARVSLGKMPQDRDKQRPSSSHPSVKELTVATRASMCGEFCFILFIALVFFVIALCIIFMTQPHLQGVIAAILHL